jgi:phosphoribosylanthranilate isomerase
LHLLQFHGSEDNDYCASFGLPFIKAIAMGQGAGPADEGLLFPDAHGLLYDGHAPGAPGGGGDVFDWSLLPAGRQGVWLAGGLNAENVAGAIRQCRPWAVDVSSGVEDSPGIKNHALIRAFVQAAKSVDLDG